MVGDGESLAITHVGTGQIGNRSRSLLLINNVLVVLQLKNLPSVSQMTRDYPCYFVFNKCGFSTKDSMMDKLILSIIN